jgi:hypothetical protein
MKDTQSSRKTSIFGLMVIVAALAVMIRGFVEAPREFAWDKATRIADRPKMLRDIAKEDAESKKWAVGDYPWIGESHREKAEAMRRLLRAKPPDPIGHVCFVITLFTTPLLIAGIVVREVIRLRRRSEPAC